MMLRLYLVLVIANIAAVAADSRHQCRPEVQPVGIMHLPFHPAFLTAQEFEGEQSLFVTSFFNVAFNPEPGGPPVFQVERDLVARINDLEELEENPDGYHAVVPQVLTGPGIVWPNDAIKAPDGVFPFDALVITQGFLQVPLPGRLTVINLSDSDNTEYVIHQSTQLPGVGFTHPFDPDNMPRFYHDVIFHDMDNDGYDDIITVRSGIRSGLYFYPPFSELVWFKNPGPADLDPATGWEETVLYGGPFVGFAGPDIALKTHDFDGDGVPEIVATHFFTGPEPATSADSGKITLYAAPESGDWSQVDAFNLSAPQARTKDLSLDQGKPFGIEFVDLNADGLVDILCTNHQPDNSAAFPSAVPGRVYALEQPEGGDWLGGNWTTHILLDNIRPNPSLAGARGSRLAPGLASAIYPFSRKKRRLKKKKQAKEQKQKKRSKQSKKSKSAEEKQEDVLPWIVVGGDEASKVWLLQPTSQEWDYEAHVIFDINEFYGANTSQTLLDDPFGITISSIGKVIATDSVEKNGDLLLYVPVFEADDIHVFRLTNDCSAT